MTVPLYDAWLSVPPLHPFFSLTVVSVYFLYNIKIIFFTLIYLKENCFVSMALQIELPN